MVPYLNRTRFYIGKNIKRNKIYSFHLAGHGYPKLRFKILLDVESLSRTTSSSIHMNQCLQDLPRAPHHCLTAPRCLLQETEEEEKDERKR